MLENQVMRLDKDVWRLCWNIFKEFRYAINFYSIDRILFLGNSNIGYRDRVYLNIAFPHNFDHKRFLSFFNDLDGNFETA